jgi:hypothetical protein
MITKGKELYDFMTQLNGGASIDISLASILVSNAKAILEEERPWNVLLKTDKSKKVSSNDTWETGIDLSTIEDLSRLYVTADGTVFRLFDGENRVEYYTLKPFDQRLEYKDVSQTCVYDENAKILYLNGKPPFSGTIWLTYVSTSPEININDMASTAWSVFPSRFLPILAYYAIGIFKGAVDYDSINRQMLPTNQTVLNAIKNAMESWDNEKSLSTIQSNDPTEFPGSGYRSGAINRYEY